MASTWFWTGGGPDRSFYHQHVAWSLLMPTQRAYIDKVVDLCLLDPVAPHHVLPLPSL